VCLAIQPAVRPWPTAVRHDTVEADGLNQPWAGARLAQAAVRPRTGKWLEGRLDFHHPDGVRAEPNAGAPSALVAYGYDKLCRLMTRKRNGRLIKR
jgi:hypothetical protein